MTAATTAPRSSPRSRHWRRSTRSRTESRGRFDSGGMPSMTEQAEMAARPTGPVGRALHRTADVLAIFGGILSCVMAAVVTISVAGRYLLSWPIPGDYDIVGILCGCAIFAFLPYCQLKRGNVLADFFTQKA